MTEESNQSTANTHSRRLNMHKAARVAAAALALGSAGALAKNAEAAAANHKPPAHKNKTILKFGTLRNPNQLPGKSEVTGGTQELLADATVKIAVNENGEITEWCSGVKVNINGNIYVLTSAHCFAQLTNENDGRFAIPDTGAMNYIGATGKLQYSIIDPSASPMLKDTNPVAMVTGISIDTNDIDMALLQVEPVAPVDQVPTPGSPPQLKGGPTYDGRTYDEIPALNVAGPTSNLAHELKPGDQVAQYGIPQTSGNTGISTVGKYLGKVTYAKDGNPYQLYLVGINAKNEASDECEFGSSGSGALTEQGYFLPSLSIRNDPGSVYDLTVQQQRLLTDYGMSETINQIKDDWLNARLSWEMQLNVKMPYTTICAYNVPQSSTYLDLVNGFNTPAPTASK